MLDFICAPIREELARVEDLLSHEAISGVASMDSIARHVLENGGKRVRPALFLLASRVTGASGEMLAPFAAAIEMIHTASLMHDDVVDDAAMRRGFPSARARWGNQVSVLIGDLLLCRASRIVVRFENTRMLKAMTEAIAATTDGELLEIAHQNDVRTDADTYMKIISGKTAALFALAARSAAIAAGVAGNFEEALMHFGFEVGRAFQLTDDALDYVADETRLGKSAGMDLKEGKLTYPLIVALSKASPQELSTIKGALIAGRTTPEGFKEVASIIDRHGGIEATLSVARNLSSRAKERLSIFKPSIERDCLFALADYVVARRE